MRTEVTDFMNSILSKSQQDAKNGISPKEKRKQLDISDILEENTLEIVENSIPTQKSSNKKTGNCKWEDVKGTSYYFKVPVELWSDTKIFCYFRYLCGKKDKGLRTKIAMSIGPALHARFIKRLRDELSKKLDYTPTNSLIKRYVEWFVQVVDVNKFDLYDVCNSSYIKKFINLNIHKEKSKDSFAHDMDKIEECYNAGGVFFLVNYGITNCFSWLIENKGKSDKEAKDLLGSFYKDASRSNLVFSEKIKEITKNTYPSSKYKDNKFLIELLNDIGLIIKETV